jgi:hypothetical protein
MCEQGAVVFAGRADALNICRMDKWHLHITYCAGVAAIFVVALSPAYVVTGFDGHNRQFISGYDGTLPTELVWAPAGFWQLQRFILMNAFVCIALSTTLAYNTSARYDVMQLLLLVATLVLWVLLWLRRYSANQQAGHASVQVQVPLLAEMAGGMLLFFPAALAWGTNNGMPGRTKKES